MIRRAFSFVLGGFSVFAVSAACVACSPADGDGNGSTKSANSGGALGSGGVTGSQVAGSTGSSVASGTLMGGTSGMGGSANVAQGGMVANGGSSTKGGSTGQGGNTAKGGSAGTGGGVSKGGSTGQGGSTAKGGSTATGASTAMGGNASQSGGAGTTAGGTGSSASTAAAASTDPLIGGVAFTTPSQTFKSQIQVEMSTSVTGAEIRYTVDGKLPTASSTSYAGQALTFKTTTQLRAQAFVGGAASGAVSTAIYVARTIDPTSDIPILLVESYGKPKPCDKETYIDAAVMIWEPVDGVAKMASLPTLVARAGYHVRGQSSMAFAQTPYKVELWDNANNDLDYPVLGMPADSDWALIAPYYDRTLIRNPFVYTLGKDMGMEAPRTANAEVYVNQTTHAIADTEYEGIYWVSELIKNNKVRTNLKQLEEGDTELPKITGGYIFKFDEAAAEEPKLLCAGSNPVKSVFNVAMGGGGTTTKETPASTTKCSMSYGTGTTTTGTAGTCWKDLEVVDPDPLNTQQKGWLTDYIQQFHDSLHKTPIGDYSTYIDLQTFIDYLLISELTRNVDAYVRSAYFFKERDGKLKAGPLWDYNFALGGVGAQSATPTSSTDPGWQFTGTGRNVNNWYPKLTGDSNFMAQVKTRYTELRKTLWSDASLKERMDTLSAPLKQAVVRDYTRWPVTGVILSTTGFTGGPTTPTWEGQLKVMSDFITARLAWMDANLK